MPSTCLPNKLTVGGLFSGIGGFELGLVRAGFEIIWMVEIDEFCQKVLRKNAPDHWPNARIYGDIKNVGKENLTPPDVIVGGFPCQPFSQAGDKRGKADDRFLWPEMLRVIRELSPRWIIGENVAGFIGMELEGAFIDLETEGYQIEAFVLPACGIGALHERERIWIMAYPSSQRQYEPSSKSNALGSGRAARMESKISNLGRCQPATFETMAATQTTLQQWPPEPAFCRVADGIPRQVDRLRGLGNAVVPQIPELLGRMILEVEGLTQ